ncbi:MAG TPA: hypothetical protein PK093_08615 [Phycisphaerae bacterium]|nr:hypothetical protein [Phycisphaerae bacterium]
MTGICIDTCECRTARTRSARSIATAAIAVAALLGLTSAANAQSDDCAGATPVVTGTNAGGNNCGASAVDDAEAGCQANSGLDLFYVWTADCTGEATIDTENSAFTAVNDTVLSIYDACGGNEIACDDDGSTGPNTLLSVVTFNCVSGQDYIIRVAGYDASGTIRCGDVTLNIACVAGGVGACCHDDTCTDVTGGVGECGPLGGIYLGDGTQCGVNACPTGGDVCSSAIVVGSGTTLLSNAGNVVDDPDPSCTTSGAADVWAVYTVEQNGSLLIDTCGTFLNPNNATAIDTVLAAYDSFCGGAELDCDDDCRSDGTIPDPAQASCIDAPQTGTSTRDSCICIDSVTIGQQIFIQIQDFGGTDLGEIVLNITPNGCPPPTGSCCLFDGSCTIDSASGCANAGGVYGGDGSDCSLTCDGACCILGSGCSINNEAACVAAGGSFGGRGTVCFAYDINTGVSNGGYICEGSCADLVTLRNSPAQSGSIDIMFNNDLATADVVEGSCTGGGGVVANDAIFRYLAISDTNGPCDVTITLTPTGYDAVLVVGDNCPGSELACSDSGGVGGAESVTIPNYGPGAFVYIQAGDFGTTEGGGETRLEITCSTATGACCTGGTCEVLTAGNCLLAGGVYKGDGSECATSCFGACCEGSGTCSEMTEEFCVGVGGAYQGDGVSCTPNPCPQPPANDTCATPTMVDCNTGTIAGISLDLANPDHALMSTGSCTGFSTNGPEVVFAFTAPSDLLVHTGMANVSGFDAAIYVVTDCQDTNGSCVAGDDSGGIEEVTFTATQGVTYYIITDSYTEAPDPGTTFDFFIECSAICGTCPGDVNGDSALNGLDIQAFTACYLSEFGATPSAACKCADVEDDNVIDAADIAAFVDALLNGGGICNAGSCCYLDGGLTACVVTDEAGCNTLAGVFTLGADCNDDPCPAGRCCSNGGATCVDLPELECAALGGEFAAGLNCTNNPCPQPLTHDDCLNARVVTTLPYTDSGVDIGSATDDFNVFPDCLGSSCDAIMGANNGVWYTYTPDSDCNATIGATGSGFDGATSVWTGPDCANLTQIACSDPSTFNVDLTGGVQYWILVSNWSCASEPVSLVEFSINCEVPPPPPVNDECAGALTIMDGATPIDLTAATDSGLPACGDFSLAPDAVRSDLFYTYVATCTGTLFVDTCGNSFDARIAIYDTIDCATINGGALPIECNDDHGNALEGDTGNVCAETLASSFSIPVTAGNTYMIRVGSYGAPPSTGMFNLNISCTP